MNDLNRQAQNVRNEPTAMAGLDAQLLELIEFVWACEASARREDRIDAAIRCGRLGLEMKATAMGGG